MSKPSATRFITLQELCDQIGISKASFYKYQRLGIFPAPLRTNGGHLVFDQELTNTCLQVVHSRTGINGEPVIFRSRRSGSKTVTAKHSPTRANDGLVTALGSLGLSTTPALIEEAKKQLPADLPEPELIRQLFLRLRTQK